MKQVECCTIVLPLLWYYSTQQYRIEQMYIVAVGTSLTPAFTFRTANRLEFLCGRNICIYSVGKKNLLQISKTKMATAGVFDIELNEDGANDTDHSDEEPIKPASEEHVQVMIVGCLSLIVFCLWGRSASLVRNN